jgi:hypothetical protein
MTLSTNIEAAKNVFAARHGLPQGGSGTVEAFFTHNVLLHRNLNDFLAEQSWRGERKILVGGAQDIQLDAIVVCLNDKPIRPDDDLAELEAILAEGERPHISFVFVQATSEETTGRKLGQKISSFSDGVLSFFLNNGSDSTGINSTIMEWIELKMRIFGLLEDNDVESACECAMYFVWPKVLTPDDNISRVIGLAESKIRLIPSVFGRVEFHAFDRRRIESVIAAAESDREKPNESGVVLELPAANFVRVPQPANVAASYIGFLSAHDLLGMITEKQTDPPDLALRHGIFARNIRSYLGSGQRVNNVMAETLKDPAEQREFGIRSNGIAILAESQDLNGSGKLTLTGAQIPNGCQTCHVLFENRELLANGLGKEICIPVKVIVTADTELAGRTALGLNRQTPVDETRLFTGPEVVDALAWRYSDPSTHPENRALFERRQDEYADAPADQRIKVLTPYLLAQSYASAFLPRPETVNTQGRKPIIDQIRKEKIFGRNQDVTPYFLAGVMVLRAREALESHPHTKAWDRYPAKNLLLYAMRLIAQRKTDAADAPEDLEGDAGKAYIAHVSKALLDPPLAKRIAEEAIRCIILATSDARIKLNAKNAGTAELAGAVRERAIRAVF